VIRRLELSMETGAVLALDREPYQGPWALLKGGGGGYPPPAQEPPEEDDPEVEEARRREREAMRRRRGRRATILTGAQGVEGPAPGTRRTLLGSGAPQRQATGA